MGNKKLDFDLQTEAMICNLISARKHVDAQREVFCQNFMAFLSMLWTDHGDLEIF